VSFLGDEVRGQACNAVRRFVVCVCRRPPSQSHPSRCLIPSPPLTSCPLRGLCLPSLLKVRLATPAAVVGSAGRLFVVDAEAGLVRAVNLFEGYTFIHRHRAPLFSCLSSVAVSHLSLCRCALLPCLSSVATSHLSLSRMPLPHLRLHTYRYTRTVLGGDRRAELADGSRALFEVHTHTSPWTTVPTVPTITEPPTPPPSFFAPVPLIL
jgi:hypothetical protein